MLGWAVSDLWTELVEFTDGFKPASLKAEVLALVGFGRSEYFIDPFNIFDLWTTLCASVGFVVHLVVMFDAIISQAT